MRNKVKNFYFKAQNLMFFLVIKITELSMQPASMAVVVKIESSKGMTRCDDEEEGRISRK